MIASLVIPLHSVRIEQTLWSNKRREEVQARSVEKEWSLLSDCPSLTPLQEVLFWDRNRSQGRNYSWDVESANGSILLFLSLCSLPVNHCLMDQTNLSLLQETSAAVPRSPEERNRNHHRRCLLHSKWGKESQPFPFRSLPELILARSSTSGLKMGYRFQRPTFCKMISAAIIRIMNSMKIMSGRRRMKRRMELWPMLPVMTKRKTTSMIITIIIRGRTRKSWGPNSILLIIITVSRRNQSEIGPRR